MALTTRIATVNMISVHEEEDGLFYDIPNVLPGKFWIPPVTAAKQTLINRCKTAVRTAGSPAPERLQYAHLKTTTENPPQNYVLLTIPEATTFRYGTEKQVLDEYNQKMFPDIERAPLYVKPEQLANDIERAFGQIGVIAIANYDGAEGATQVELKRARERYKAWMLRRINEINKQVSRPGGFAEVTKQTLGIVHRAYRDRWIAALPTWAFVNADMEVASGSLACKNCHALLHTEAARCEKCGTIHNWQLAIAYGLKTEAEVPKQFRREAGLERPIPAAPKPTPTVVGTLPDNAVVAIVGADGSARVIESGDVPLDPSDQAFGGEQIRGTNVDQDKVVDEIANLPDEPNARPPAKIARRGGR